MDLGELIQSWSASAGPNACFGSTEEKCKLATSAEQRRSRKHPRNQCFRQLLGISSPNLFLGPARLLTAFLARRHGSSTNGETPRSQISREHSLTLAPKRGPCDHSSHLTDEKAEVSPRVTEPRPEWNSFLTGGLVIWGPHSVLLPRRLEFKSNKKESSSSHRDTWA